MNLRKREEYPRLTLLLIVAISALLLLVIYQSYSLAKRMVERYTPLIDATMEIKLEATTAHLWFEEYLNGDSSVDIDQVRDHLQKSIWYCGAMLEGGSTGEWRFIPLDDKRLRSHIENVRRSLQLLSQQLEERLQQNQDTGAVHDFDQRFDTAFGQFIHESDLVERRLQQLMGNAMTHFRRVQFLLFVLIGLIATAMLFSLGRYHQRRLEQLRLMSGVNRELRSEVDRRKQIERVLEHQATTDMLTGIANRLHMSRLIEQEIARSGRYDEPFSLLMFDIDHFKQINDQYGHDRGDEVLKEVARRGTSVLRESDTLSRWGGEEFLILLPGTGLEGAHELAERCRESIAGEPFAEVGRVTASFGVAQYCEGETQHVLLRRVDLALYRSKAAGRNNVKLA